MLTITDLGLPEHAFDNQRFKFMHTVENSKDEVIGLIMGSSKDDVSFVGGSDGIPVCFNLQEAQQLIDKMNQITENLPSRRKVWNQN